VIPSTRDNDRDRDELTVNEFQIHEDLKNRANRSSSNQARRSKKVVNQVITRGLSNLMSETEILLLSQVRMLEEKLRLFEASKERG
jgi:hypothetical protein